jgi:membrane associated rhomboid family serine protease
MFPIRDENPTLRTPVVTFALIGLNVLAWLVLQRAGTDPGLAESVCSLGVIPGEITGEAAGKAVRLGPAAVCQIAAAPEWHTLLTSMFMHGSWMHIAGNMWFLWIFGNNVEDSMGRGRFVLFYVLGGLAAAAAQILTDPASPVPMVGASGAIGAVMGAYVVLYPRVPVHMFVFFGFFVTTFRIPAYLMLGYWFVLQLVGALPSVGQSGGGVAFWAHLGGFLAGVGLIFLFRDAKLVEEHRRVLKKQGFRYGRVRRPRAERPYRRPPHW